MSVTRDAETKRKVHRTARARKHARDHSRVVFGLAVVVVVGVIALLTRRVLAARHEVRVLDCPVTYAVAHHHDDSCYDDEGNLVCVMPERDVHVHDESCYERQLVCGIPEGEGVHYHDEGCFDEWGDLTCGLEETHGHQHDDGCYADVLICGHMECTEEHVHGEGCFHTVAANEDAEEVTHPAQAFHHDIRDKDNKLQMRIDVEASVGTLPAESTMDAELLEADKVNLELVQKALDERVTRDRDAAKTEEAKAAVEAGRVLSWQALNVTFRDAAGNEIQPAGDVTVKLTSDLAKAHDAHAVVHVEDEEEAQRRSEEEGITQTDGTVEPQAWAVDQLSDKQIAERKLDLKEDQVAFDADASTTYVLTTTSLRHEMGVSDGATARIEIDAPAEAGIPQDAHIDASVITPGTEEYGSYVDRTVESMGAKESDVALANFFDIKIVDGNGNEIHPKAPVDVKIELADIPDAPNGFAAVHFKATGEDGSTELERLTCGGENGTVTFTTESFSVYGIVYTVDFGYEVNGTLYEYTLPGGGSVGLRELVDALHIWETDDGRYWDAGAFMAEVQNVTFSDQSLVWVEQVTQRTSLGQLLEVLDLHPEYTDETTDEQKSEWMAKEYEADWVLASLKPFTTTEMLTITMSDGSQRLVQVTDQQNAPLKPDPDNPGQYLNEVQTIANPAGTTIDLFDYWVDDARKNSNERDAWPGWLGNWRYDGYNFDGSPVYVDSDGVNHPGEIQQRWNNETQVGGRGTWDGINAGHTLKFTPANDRTVLDVVNGTQVLQTDGGSSVSCWTRDADPRQGIVDAALRDANGDLDENGHPVKDGSGYPILTNDPDTLGTDGQSLAYLFDDSAADNAEKTQQGKAYYPQVNNLLYVDPDGYYMYDSNEYSAKYDDTSKSFTVRPHPDNVTDNGRGFWPFIDKCYWFGMHMRTDYSMPGLLSNGKKGQVLNPKGKYNDMVFEFMGDDDTWIYIDGVLVGDGGGIHNKTKITINYATGDVVVTGDHPEGGPQGTDTYITTLRDLLMPQDDPGKYGFTEADFDGNTFAPGTYHTFDMFYLERGGGESNLKIRYNLVITADFTAHKEFRDPNNEDAAFQRDQFKFELVGLDKQYEYHEKLGDDQAVEDFWITEPQGGFDEELNNAVMPQTKTNEVYREAQYYETDRETVQAQGQGGTVAQPYRYPGYQDVDGDMVLNSPSVPITLIDGPEGERTEYAQVLATGVSEDGNVNFGMADVTDEVGEAYFEGKDPAYRYLVREIIPADAVNPSGKLWRDCTEEERRAGGFVKDHILYDSSVYYMAGVVTFWGGQPGISKRYFADDTFTTKLDEQISFINFKNYIISDPEPLRLKVKKSTEQGDAMQNVSFSLTPAVQDMNEGTWSAVQGATAMTGQTNSAGELLFGNGSDSLGAGYYILEETQTLQHYNLPKNKWLVEIRRVDEPHPAEDNPTMVSHYEPYVSILNSDGTVTTYADSPKDLDNYTFEQPITNSSFSFPVEKRWLHLDLSNSDDWAAVENSEVVVTLGRYTVVDQAGVLNILKTGVPEHAHVTATYVVKDSNGVVQATLPVSSWDGSDVAVAKLSLAPGAYTVEETISNPDDDRYGTHDHPQSGSDHIQTVTIEDGEEQTVTFTSNYIPKLGSIRITSSLDNRTNLSADTSRVIYSAIDADGIVRGTCTFAEASANGGCLIDNLLVGQYTVVESGWPELPSRRLNFTHNPDGQSVACNVTENGQANAAFSTTYEQGVWVRVLEYYIDAHDQDDGTSDGWTSYDISTARETGIEQFITTDTAQLRIWAQPQELALGRNGHTLVILRIGDLGDDDRYNNSVVWDNPDNGGSWNWTGQYGTITVPMPTNGDGTYDIYVGRKWTYGDRQHPIGLTNSNRSGRAVAASPQQVGSSPENAANAANSDNSLLRGTVVPSDNSQSSSDHGNTPTPSEANKKYVIDETFTGDNTVTLTKDDLVDGVWREVVEGLPVDDGYGNKYYYYIESVAETNLPDHTELSIVKDGENQVLAFHSTNGNPNTLAVENDVARPADVDIYKNDAADTTKALGGAKFELQKKDDHDEYQTIAPSNLTLTPRVSGQAATVDGNSFAVPEGGVRIEGLDLGEYRLVETAPPAGYVLQNPTTFDFTVARDGTISGDAASHATTTGTPYSNSIVNSLNISNTPGEELPHSGGSVTAIVIGGSILIAFGALALLRSRRRTAEVGERR